MKNLLKLALLVFILIGCSKSNDSSPDTSTNLPFKVSKGNVVKSITTQYLNNGEYEDYRWNFLYSSDYKMTSGTSQIVYTGGPELVKVFSFTYSLNKVSMIWGNTFYDCSLNSAGFIQQIKITTGSPFDEDNILITYTNDGYLSSIKSVRVNGERIATFTYQNGNLTKIVSTSKDGLETETETFIYTYGNEINKAGLLCPFENNVATVLGDIANLYYAGLLGKPSKNLATSASYFGDYGQKSETYTYALFDGYVTSCTVNATVSGLDFATKTSQKELIFNY